MSKTVFTIDDTKQKFQLTVPDDGIVIPFITSISNPTAQVDNENRKIILNHNMSYSKIYYSYNKNDLLTPTNGTLYDRSNLNGIVPVIDTSKESGWYSGTIYYVAVVSDVASSVMSVSYDFDVRVGDIFNVDNCQVKVFSISMEDSENVWCFSYPNIETLYDISKNTYTLDRLNSFPAAISCNEGESINFTDFIINYYSSSISTDLTKLRENRSDSWLFLNKGDYEKIVSLGKYFDKSYDDNEIKIFLGVSGNFFTGSSYIFSFLNKTSNIWEIKTDIYSTNKVDEAYYNKVIFLIGCYFPISKF